MTYNYFLFNDEGAGCPLQTPALPDCRCYAPPSPGRLCDLNIKIERSCARQHLVTTGSFLASLHDRCFLVAVAPPGYFVRSLALIIVPLRGTIISARSLSTSPGGARGGVNPPSVHAKREAFAAQKKSLRDFEGQIEVPKLNILKI